MLGAATLFGGSYVYVCRFLVPHGLPALALVTWQMGLALVLLLLVTDLSGMGELLQHPRALAGVTLGLGVLGTGLALLIYYALLERLSAAVSAAVTCLTPAVALVIGWANGEAAGLRELSAAGVILLGIALVQRGRSRAVMR